jgi:hypothetical protein
MNAEDREKLEEFWNPEDIELDPEDLTGPAEFEEEVEAPETDGEEEQEP